MTSHIAEPTLADGDSVRRRFDEYRRTGERRLRNQLIEEHRPLAVRIARQFAHRGEPQDDLVQVALLALLKAVERFDPERDVAFSTFATPTIRGELKRHFRDHTWGVRVPRRTKDRHLQLREATDRLSQQLQRSPTIAELAHDLRCSTDELLEAVEAGAGYRSTSASTVDGTAYGWLDVRYPDHERGFDAIDARDLVADLLRTLPPREQELMRLRFLDELTQAEIGRRMGISQMQVSRLLHRSLDRLRNRFDLVAG